MAAPRRKPTESNVVPLGERRPRPRAADGFDAPGAAPVQAQIGALEAAFAEDAPPRLRAQPRSDLWRVVIIVGASLGLWAGVYQGASHLLSLAH